MTHSEPVYMRLLFGVRDINGAERHWSEKAARRLIRRLDGLPYEAEKAGITPDQWAAFVHNVTAEADGLDAAWAARDQAELQEWWADMEPRLIKAGGIIIRSSETKDLEVTISGYGNVMIIRLEDGSAVTRDMQYDDILSPHSFFDPLEVLARYIRHRDERADERDRLARIRQTHAWSQHRKAWLPKTGGGPAVRWAAGTKTWEAA